MFRDFQFILFSSLLFFLPIVLAADNLVLKTELLEMQVVAQEMRNWIQEVSPEEKEQIELELNKVDNQNSERLKQMVAEFGWPSKDLVGADGVLAAFSILEYSSDFSFQQSMLPELEKAFVSNGGISGQTLALFEDRLLVNLGKKQKYGTQVYIAESKAVPTAIENEEIVDELRAEKGLIPLDAYLDLMSKLHGDSEE